MGSVERFAIKNAVFNGMSRCAVWASRPDSLKIVKTGAVARNAAQQPKWPGDDRKEWGRVNFFAMRPMFFPAMRQAGMDGGKTHAAMRCGCGTHGALRRTFGQCRKAEDRSHARHRPRQEPAGCCGRHVRGRHDLHACDGKDAGQSDTGRASAGGRCASAHGPGLRTGP